jgi:hypothetical protein
MPTLLFSCFGIHLPRKSMGMLTALSIFVWSSLGYGATSLENTTVRSAEDLTKCFEIQPYAARQDTQGGATGRWIDEGAIGLGCTEKAVALANQRKGDTQLLQALAEEVRRSFRPEASLKIFRVLAEADKSKAICEDSALYAALMAGLSHPTDYPNRTDSDFKNARAVVESCLPSKDFTSDVKEDAEADKPYISANLCTILKARKIASHCKEAAN